MSEEINPEVVEWIQREGERSTIPKIRAQAHKLPLALKNHRSWALREYKEIWLPAYTRMMEQIEQARRRFS